MQSEREVVIAVNEIINNIFQNLDATSLSSLQAVLLLIQTIMLTPDNEKYSQDIVKILNKFYNQMSKIDENTCLCTSPESIKLIARPKLKFFINPVLLNMTQARNKDCL